MAICWQHLRPWQDSLSRWKRLQHGAVPLPATQAQLFEHFPQLRSLYKNPLWSVIGQPEREQDWDELADTIRIGVKPLDGYGGKLSRLLLDRADWPCLAVHLVLLHTHSTRFLFHRLWLKQNFMALLGLSCLQRPLFPIRAELQALFPPTDVRAKSSTPPNRMSCPAGWAADEVLLQLLQQRSWLFGDDQNIALLIWNFRQEVQHELDVGPPQFMGKTGRGLPRPLRKKWCRKQVLWLDNPVHLNGVCCESFDHGAPVCNS
jgi:hypothetical protein